MWEMMAHDPASRSLCGTVSSITSARGERARQGRRVPAGRPAGAEMPLGRSLRHAAAAIGTALQQAVGLLRQEARSLCQRRIVLDIGDHGGEVVAHFFLERGGGRHGHRRSRQWRPVRFPYDLDAMRQERRQSFQLEGKGKPPVADASLFQIDPIGVGQHAGAGLIVNRHQQTDRTIGIIFVADPAAHALPISLFDVPAQRHAGFLSHPFVQDSIRSPNQLEARLRKR